MTRLRRLIFVAVFGLGGIAVLLSLGFWQLDRLLWKEALIKRIEARAIGEPTLVTGREAPRQDDHRAAQAVGRFSADAKQLRYLTSYKLLGPGFRLIAPFELKNGVRILVDRGFAPEAIAPRLEPAPPPPTGERTLRGLLRWPSEVSKFTPEPNLEAQLWFARDVASMAKALGTEPVLLVLAPRAQPPSGPTEWPAPVPEKIDLPNNHLGYALTWFSLAAIWLAMTGIFAFKTRDRNETALAR